jgi:alpha-tubulin suppressor-like RCC1 family protein
MYNSKSYGPQISSQIAGGWRHTVALDEDGQMYGWGWNKVISNQSRTQCIISPLQTVCKLWASIVSVTRLTDGSGTLLQFGQVGVNNTEDQNYPQIVKGLVDQVTFKTILSRYHLVLR